MTTEPQTDVFGLRPIGGQDIAVTLGDDGWWTATGRYSPRHDIQDGMGMTPGRAIQMLERRFHTWETGR